MKMGYFGIEWLWVTYAGVHLQVRRKETQDKDQNRTHGSLPLGQKAGKENPSEIVTEIEEDKTSGWSAQVVDSWQIRKEKNYVLDLKVDQQELVRDFTRAPLVESTNFGFQRAWNKNKIED